MKKLILAIMLVCIIWITACYVEEHALSAVARGQVIAMHDDGNGMLRIERIAEDDCGRVLYCAKNKTQLYPDVLVYAYIICQRIDNTDGYCYPDICYEISENRLETSDKRIQDLKTRNDWGKELCLSKCRRESWVNSNRFNTEDVRTIFLNESKKQDDYIIISQLSGDANGNTLFAVGYSAQSNRLPLDSSVELYIMVLDSSMNCIALEPLVDPLSPSAQIIGIKQKIGWEEICAGD